MNENESNTQKCREVARVLSSHGFINVELPCSEVESIIGRICFPETAESPAVNENELLNCPFCGCAARDKLFLGERIAFIDCANKDCAIYNETIPIEKWQTRTAPKSTEVEYNCPPVCPKCHSCHRGECKSTEADKIELQPHLLEQCCICHNKAYRIYPVCKEHLKGEL